MPTLTKHQKRYDKCIEKRLPLEFKWFIDNMTSRHPISKKLKDASGLQLFINHALKNGYLLGMKPFLISEELMVEPQNIGWRFESTTKKPFPNHRRGGKDPAKTIDTSMMFTGFGITLNLLGWKLFIGTTFDMLINQINSGKNIEEVYNVFRGFSEPKLYFVGEKSYVLSEALEKAGISMSVFKKALYDRAVLIGCTTSELSTQERQLVLNELIKKSQASGGIIQKYSHWYVQISNADLTIIQQNAEQENITPQEFVHKIIQSYSYQ